MKWYIILSGSAKIYSENNLFPPRIYNVGEYFGEGALSQKGLSRRMASVIALTELRLLTLEK